MIARFKMAGLHLLGSAVIVGSVLCLIYLIWYPYPYYIFHSTINATKLVVMVDLVIGPLLTFVVFNTVKSVKELKRDLSVIILVQILALSWGVYITYSVRPHFTVYFNGEVNSVTGVSYDAKGFDKSIAIPGIFERPQLVYIKPLSKEEYRNSILRQLKGLELGFVLQTKLYTSVNDEAKEDMISRSLTRKQLTVRENNKIFLENFLNKNSFSFDDGLYYPVSAGPYNSVVVFDKKTMAIIDVLEMYVKNTTEY